LLIHSAMWSVSIINRLDGGWPRNRGSITGRGKIIFSSPNLPNGTGAQWCNG